MVRLLSIMSSRRESSIYGLVELAGLKLPFDEGCLESVVEKVSNCLDSVDVSSL